MNQRQQRFLQQKNKLKTGLSFKSSTSSYKPRANAGAMHLKRNQNVAYKP